MARNPMPAPKDLETFFRRLEILRYLAESPQPRSEPEIRKHLEKAMQHLNRTLSRYC
jgi:hypothetical protein